MAEQAELATFEDLWDRVLVKKGLDQGEGWKTLLARAGDKSAARELLADLCADIASGRPIRESIRGHFVFAFLGVLEGEPAGRALGVENPANRPQKGRVKLERDLLMCLAVKRLVRDGRGLTEAFRLVGSAWNKSPSTARRAFRDHSAFLEDFPALRDSVSPRP